MNKNELINIIDECLCHFKNGAITYTRNDLIDKIIEAVDLYHDSEVKKLNIPAVMVELPDTDFHCTTCKTGFNDGTCPKCNNGGN